MSLSLKPCENEPNSGVIPFSRHFSLTQALDKSESAIKMEVSRMRVRYREVLLEVLGHTVEDPSLAEEELRYLQRVLCR